VGRASVFIWVMVVGGRAAGATIGGAGAGEQIALWALAISARMRLATIAGMVAPYATRAEVSKRAAGAYFSPKLFDSPWLKRAVGLVQRILP
jgi:pyruvate/2-oxoglutarate dehydrogenase complex dihydrolipoamide dehydrogenase (E3) component